MAWVTRITLLWVTSGEGTPQARRGRAAAWLSTTAAREARWKFYAAVRTFCTLHVDSGRGGVMQSGRGLAGRSASAVRAGDWGF